MGVQLPIQNYFKPKPEPNEWVRPSDWPVITDTPGEVQFLVSDVNLAVYTIRTTFTRTSGNIYIDWGDGVTDTISTTTTTNTSHTYTIGTGATCSRGYTTFKVRVYGDPTCVIERCQPVAPVDAGNSLTYQMGLLEVYYGDGTSTATTSAPNYGGNGSAAAILGGFSYLEYVKLPSSVDWNTATTFMFSQNQTIQKVVLPIVGPNIGFRHFFSGCINLRGEYTLPKSMVLTGNNLESTFQNCYNVTKIVLPDNLSQITTLATTFAGCSSLKNLTLGALDNVTSFSNTFSNCISLEWIKFMGLPAPASSTNITMLNFLSGCVSLENVYFPTTCSSNAKYDCTSAFASNVNLRSIILPVGFDITTMNNMFSGCASITRIKFQNGLSVCSSITSAFNNCRNLYDLTLPPTLGVTASAQSTFTNCSSLENITIPSVYSLSGNLNGMFSGCANAKSISLPNNNQDGITALTGAFSTCYSLETVTLPTSMNGLTDLTNTFSDCILLKSVTFPSSLNAVTSMAGCFNSCFNLESVTMPTSMSSCNVFSTTFSRNKKLTSLTMPTTVATGTTWATAFNQCVNLKTLTLPTTQTTTLTDLSAAFNSCGSLTTINNVSKLGSLGSTPLVNLSLNTGSGLVTSLTFSCPMSIFTFNGSSVIVNALSSLRLLNTSTGQWTGTSPQINVSFTSLSTSALVTLFNDIAAQGTVTSKTINITSATGASGLTSADRLIITSKGWTIIG